MCPGARPCAPPSLLELIRHRNRTGFGAIVTTGALVHIYIAGFLSYLGLEVAHVALDIGHLTVGHQLDIGVGAHQAHLGGKNTGGTVQCGEGLVQLYHMSADAGLLLHQVDLVLGIGNL